MSKSVSSVLYSCNGVGFVKNPEPNLALVEDPEETEAAEDAEDLAKADTQPS